MSLKTVREKLRITEVSDVMILNAPEGYIKSLNITLIERSQNSVDIIQLFVTSSQQLEKELPKCQELLKPKGILWVTYPKLSSSIRGDLNRDVIGDYAKTLGLKSVAICGIDTTWSALRLKKTK
jgi:hypothetical protein